VNGVLHAAVETTHPGSLGDVHRASKTAQPSATAAAALARMLAMASR
jgi:hypothetical protein